jgi:hypothetical protein
MGGAAPSWPHRLFFLPLIFLFLFLAPPARVKALPTVPPTSPLLILLHEPPVDRDTQAGTLARERAQERSGCGVVRQHTERGLKLSRSVLFSSFVELLSFLPSLRPCGDCLGRCCPCPQRHRRPLRSTQHNKHRPKTKIKTKRVRGSGNKKFTLATQRKCTNTKGEKRQQRRKQTNNKKGEERCERKRERQTRIVAWPEAAKHACPTPTRAPAHTARLKRGGRKQQKRANQRPLSSPFASTQKRRVKRLSIKEKETYRTENTQTQRDENDSV